MSRKQETMVIPFPRSRERLLIYKPYINHKTIPTKNSKNIGKDKLDTSFVFQVLYTCGKNAAVVSVAAISPRISMLFISVIDNFDCYILKD